MLRKTSELRNFAIQDRQIFLKGEGELIGHRLDLSSGRPSQIATEVTRLFWEAASRPACTACIIAIYESLTEIALRFGKMSRTGPLSIISSLELRRGAHEGSKRLPGLRGLLRRQGDKSALNEFSVLTDHFLAEKEAEKGAQARVRENTRPVHIKIKWARQHIGSIGNGVLRRRDTPQ